MGISAVYGTGIYNQSVYGWVYLTSQSTIQFSSDSFLEGHFPTSATTSIDFTTSSKITQGIVSDTNLVFTTEGYIQSGRQGNISFVFSQQSLISAAKSQIEGSTTIVFSSDTFLEGHAPKRGESKITFLTKGDLFGTGEMIGDTLLKFDLRDSWINVNRVRSTDGLRFRNKAEIIFSNKNPYYPTWNGKYEDLNKQTDPSVGYFGLLYTETSGGTTPPYIETVE